MPLIPFNSYSNSADWSKLKNCPSYKVGYNRQTDEKHRKNRKIEIEMIKGAPKSSYEDQISLGCWTGYLEKIDRDIESGLSQISSEIKKNKYISDGNMVVQIRRTSCSEEYFRRKRAEIKKSLNDLLFFIESFKKEVHQISPTLVNVNLKSSTCGNLSILHASIYIGDLSIIQRLISMGADPEAKSEVGSSIDLSLNLAEKAKSLGNGIEREYREIMCYLESHIAVKKAENKYKPSLDASKSNMTPEKRAHQEGCFDSAREAGKRIKTHQVIATDHSHDVSNPKTINTQLVLEKYSGGNRISKDTEDNKSIRCDSLEIVDELGNQDLKSKSSTNADGNDHMIKYSNNIDITQSGYDHYGKSGNNVFHSNTTPSVHFCKDYEIAIGLPTFYNPDWALEYCWNIVESFNVVNFLSNTNA
eukprot:CAMPEP_0184873678 /NCGR_PEP_ID=MMETSP0580-20130426/41974_1 /TAXON_ID=1118495 /ORGANISM="Dactyliosolen fragilissimus" /LENGTH=416 /DNA_ID=CAMNT_0027376609 /DNA_START=321 /DNA_END=1571 /DNA_ORIENTATION=+